MFLLRPSHRHVNSVRYIKLSLDRHDDACDFPGTIILVFHSHSIGVRGGVGGGGGCLWWWGWRDIVITPPGSGLLVCDV